MTTRKQRLRQPAALLAEQEDSNPGPQSAPDDPRTGPNPSGDQQSRIPKGKLGLIADLLKRSEGATIEQLMNATSWQAHSVRGAMAGALTKKHGLKITSEKNDAGRVYRARAGVMR